MLFRCVDTENMNTISIGAEHYCYVNIKVFVKWNVSVPLNKESWRFMFNFIVSFSSRGLFLHNNCVSV